ncbi:MAG: GNAT family N-acetyltransferase [Clostridia bacterium]|nr:GNAT family N-acetyltransferase [Clostridia bacterium]
MKIQDLFKSENREHWLELIEKSDWSAGAFLVRLIRGGSFYETLGEGSTVLMLTEGSELISYCTFAKYDDIQPTELTPWVGFVYTFPAHRGQRRIGLLFDEVKRLAAMREVNEVFLSTNHIGLYEKYGFEYRTELIDIEGKPSRIYSLRLDREMKNRPVCLIDADESMKERMAELIAEFRCVLRSYRGEKSEPDIEAGREEFLEFLQAGYPVFAAAEGEELIGYAVCRVDQGVVWVEHLFVREAYRRRGVASLLFDKAEAFSESLGNDTAFNWVHPNNDGVIAFLRSKGYTVLNLIEIRKPFNGEKTKTTVTVNGHSFDY